MTDALNEQSRRAILRLGAVEEGTFRKHRITASGRVRDTVYLSTLDTGWPAIQARLLALLPQEDPPPVTTGYAGPSWPSSGAGAAREGGTEEGVGFEEHRGRLFGVACRMLGSRAEAEDVVQEAYLQWCLSARTAIGNQEAWLVTTATRLSIDRLRALRTQRETYEGPWLPEPFLGGEVPSPGRDVELASDLSVALVVPLGAQAPSGARADHRRVAPGPSGGPVTGGAACASAR